ncbi:SRPBCC domain-containing protein [bacterium SCSIO 12741]|nr:SRPBCC domain-containing protein [bacterium SCSIO 12741]
MQDAKQIQIEEIIECSQEQLWQVLTQSEYTRQYMFNCAVTSEWIKGGSIEWEGIYQGYNAYQKGEILEIQPFTHLQYSTFDPFYGLEDRPENYIHVTYKLAARGTATSFTIINETFDGNVKRLQHIDEGWQMVIKKLKETAENTALV